MDNKFPAMLTAFEVKAYAYAFKLHQKQLDNFCSSVLYMFC
jgi:hypothetical protein